MNRLTCLLSHRKIPAFFFVVAVSLTLPHNLRAAEGILDYNRFMNEIEPLLTTKTYPSPSSVTPMSCVACHGVSTNTAYTAFPLIPGQPRANFTETAARISLSDPDESLILLKPLDLSAGGLPHGDGGSKTGGEQFRDTQDADYQTILQWILEAKQSRSARITQTEPHPNPFRYSTEIVYYLSTRALDVEVLVFAGSGEEIRRFAGTTVVGANRVTWDGRDGEYEPVATGVYFYVVKAQFEDGLVKKNGVVIYAP